LKRKWAKKAKAVPACKVKRQAQTSAAMIGLIISTGASSLILTKPSDSAPAAEPLVEEPTLSQIPAKTEAGQADPGVNQVEPRVESPIPGDISFSTSFSTLSTPTPLVQLQAEALVIPVLSEVGQEEQTRQALNSLAVHADPKPELMPSAVQESLSNGVAGVFDRDIHQQKVLQALRVNRLIRQLKYAQTVTTSSKSDTVNRTHHTLPVVTASSQSLPVGESSPKFSEAQSSWKAKQRLLINRLKQKPNRLQDSLAEWRFEESKYSSEPVRRQETGARKQEPGKLRITKPLATSYSLRQLGIIQKLKISKVADSSTARPSTSDAQRLNEGTKSDLAKLPQHSQARVTVPNLPKIVVDRPTVVAPVAVVPAALQEYQVKAGDTLTAIAHQHGSSLAALIRANRLGNPNRLQINQRITIPVSASGSTVAQNTGWLKPPQQPHFTVSIDRPEAVSASVPPEPLAVTPSLNTAYAGMGGEISDDDTVQATPPNVDKIQRAQTAAAQEALLSNLYVQNLRTDVQKLRQKYNTQTVLTSQAVPRVDPNNTMPATTATSADKLQQKLSPPSSANQLINPEFSPNQAAKTLELERQKQRPIPVKAGEAAVRARDGLATAPLGTDATESLQYFQEQNVSPALPPLGGVDTYLPKPTSISTKGYMWPAKGRLTSPYGWRWGRMHKGIDIAAPLGTPVFASAAGVVVKAGWNSGGYGNMIDIQHADGSVTRYAHNKRILVQTGQVVQQGQQISEMGSTGFSTGPHVHFEVHPLGKQAVNPIAYLPR